MEKTRVVKVISELTSVVSMLSLFLDIDFFFKLPLVYRLAKQIILIKDMLMPKKLYVQTFYHFTAFLSTCLTCFKGHSKFQNRQMLVVHVCMCRVTMNIVMNLSFVDMHNAIHRQGIQCVKIPLK